jgi:hypothetical protein
VKHVNESQYHFAALVAVVTPLMASEPRPETTTHTSMCASFRCVFISIVIQIPKVSLGAGKACGVC